MKDKKIYLIIIGILVIYGCVFLIFVNKNDNKKSDKNNKSNNISNKTKVDKKYLVLGNNGNFAYVNNKFEKATKNEIENSKKEFSVYSDNDYIGNGSLKFVSAWNVFDKENNYLSYDGYLFAYTTDLNISIGSYVFREINDSDKEFLTNKFNITNFDYLVSNQVYEIDIDNNGEMDEIIAVTNIGDDNLENNYGIVVIKINNSIQKLIFQQAEQLNNEYYIRGFFKFDNTENYYLILDSISDYNGEIPIGKTSIYKYDGNFTKVISS